MDRLKVALCPFENRLDLVRNTEGVLHLIQRYAKEDVALLILPEGALTGYTSDPYKVNWLQNSAPELDRIRKAAEEADLSLMIGASYVEGMRRQMAYLHIGRQLTVYAKTHLGRREEKICRPGDGLVPFRWRGWQFGTALCIEGHFPEIFLTHRNWGAQVMVVPHASPVIAGDRLTLWSRYLAARAMDNGQYVLATNLYGEVDGIAFSGGAMAFAPDGSVLGKTERDPIVLTLNPEVVDKAQDPGAKRNYFERRREGLYDLG